MHFYLSAFHDQQDMTKYNLYLIVYFFKVYEETYFRTFYRSQNSRPYLFKIVFIFNLIKNLNDKNGKNSSSLSQSSSCEINNIKFTFKSIKLNNQGQSQKILQSTSSKDIFCCKLSKR